MVIQWRLCSQEEKTQSGQRKEAVCCLNWGEATLPQAKESIHENETEEEPENPEPETCPEPSPEELLEQGRHAAKRREDMLFVKPCEEPYCGKEKIVYQSLCSLLEMLFQTGACDRGKTSCGQLLARLKKKKRGKQYQLEGEAMGPTQEFGTPVLVTEEEGEGPDAFFISMGTLVTPDGSRLPFELSVEASGTFVSWAGFSVNYRAVTAVEPLVLYLQENTDHAQARRFLLDFDATEEAGCEAVLTRLPEELSLMRFSLKEKPWLTQEKEGFDGLRIWTKDEYGKNRLAAVGVQSAGIVYLPEQG